VLRSTSPELVRFRIRPPRSRFDLGGFLDPLKAHILLRHRAISWRQDKICPVSVPCLPKAGGYNATYPRSSHPETTLQEPPLRSHELTLGRSFAVAFDHGDDFFTALTEFCYHHGVRQGYIPGFIAGFSQVQIVGTCDKLDDPDAPVWTKVYLANVEAFGGGTLAYDPVNNQVGSRNLLTYSVRGVIV
jgi:hypothetical protein